MRISGRDAPGFRRTLNPITSVLRRERRRVDTHRDHVKMEAVDTHRDHVKMKMWLNGSDAATSQWTDTWNHQKLKGQEGAVVLLTP